MCGSRLGSGLIYWLMKMRIFVAKSCIGGERVWFLMALKSEYPSHSYVNLSSGITVW